MSHLTNLSRVYGPDSWDVYELLDQSLDPRSPDWLYERASAFLRPGDLVLDAGCRDGAQLIELVRRFGVRGVGVEPVAIHVERARAAVVNAGLAGRIEIARGTMEELTHADGHFDFVWCRDVLEQVEPLVPALRNVARVLRPGGYLLAFTVVATDLLDAADWEMLCRHLGNVEANLREATLEGAFRSAGLTTEHVEFIGTEWREYAEERTQPVSRALLRLARLRRQRENVIAQHGEDIYHHIEANLHWEVFQFLGKLKPLVYLLRRADA